MKIRISGLDCWSIAIVILICLTTAISNAQNSVNGPVKISGKCVTTKSDISEGQTPTFTINVDVQVDDGWHIYDVVPKGTPVSETTVSIKYPNGVVAVGDLERPFSLPYIEKPGTKIFQGTVSFSQKVKVSESFDSGKVKVALKYQVCNVDRCQPPTEQTVSVAIPKLDDKDADGNDFDLFATPELLMVAGKPLNSAAKQMYPSPAIFDVDNDGKMELVVGDIFGSLNIYENQNLSGQGDPVWSEYTPLKSIDNKPIKVSNW